MGQAGFLIPFLTLHRLILSALYFFYDGNDLAKEMPDGVLFSPSRRAPLSLPLSLIVAYAKFRVASRTVMVKGRELSSKCREGWHEG
jgi:hypothetical protein